MAARKLNYLIFATIFNCIIGIIFIGVALGTNFWFKAEAESSDHNINVTVRYGIFKGEKQICNPTNCQNYALILTCSGNDCMYSCGTTSSNRKKDIENAKNDDASNIDTTLCISSDQRIANKIFAVRQEGSVSVPEKKFLNFGFLVATLFFICLTMLFNFLSGALALYNTYRAPIQPILSVFGLYIWNGIAAASLLLGLILWGVIHSTLLGKNAAISDTLTGGSGRYKTKNANIQYSFWLLLPALLLSIANLAILKFRAMKIVKMEEKHVKVMNETLDNGDILLF